MPTRPVFPTRSNIDTLFIRWTGLLQGDDGAAYAPHDYPDRTVQVTGTFGGATVTIQGSNDPTATDASPPTAWFTLTDQTGGALVFTAAGGRLIVEATRWIRPLVTGGDGTTSVTADVVARR